MTIEHDYAYCKRIIQQHSKTFHLSFSRLPEHRANGIFAVYAFCRRADDAVDEHSDPVKLQQIHQELTEFSAGHVPCHPMWRALHHTFTVFQLKTQPFFQLLEGQQLDLGFTQPESQDQLEQYCYLVAGTVGLMILPIIAQEHAHRLEPSAIALGKAMQLTNILRDVGQDYRMGRIYLPREVMLRYEYTPDDIGRGNINRAFIDLWEHEAQQAEEYYEQAQRDYHLYDAEGRFPVILAANVYRALLDTIRRNDYDCLTKRNYVSRAEKARLLAASRQQSRTARHHGKEKRNAQ